MWGMGSLGGNASVKIPKARTIAEANVLAVSLGLAKHADFGKLDVSVANEMMQVVANTQGLNSGIPTLTFLGSLQVFKKQYMTKKPKNVYAVYANLNATNGWNGIGVNEKYFSSKNLAVTLEMLKQEVTSQWHPVGSGSIKGIVDHEIGHWIGHKLGANQDSKIASLYTKHSGKGKWERIGGSSKFIWKTPMDSVLSQYANTNIKEFIAEAWSEYRNNPKPRPLAKQVGDIIMQSYMGGNTK